MVTGKVRRLRQRLAGSAGGRRDRLRNRGAAACRRSVRHLAPCRRRGQQQGVADPRWCHWRQRHRCVQAGAAALWRLRRAVQLGRQETVLVLSTSNLRGNDSDATVLIGASKRRSTYSVYMLPGVPKSSPPVQRFQLGSHFPWRKHFWPGRTENPVGSQPLRAGFGHPCTS